MRVAYIENGGTWAGDLLHKLQVLHGQNPGLFAKNPVDQFHDNCWVAPFVEDSVPELARTSRSSGFCSGPTGPTRRALRTRANFFKLVEEFSIDDQRKIMVENARRAHAAVAQYGLPSGSR